MNFVIPMAGRGQRFIDAGYKLPKMLIEARGKSLLEWSIDSLPLELCTNLVCVLLQQHEDEFQLSNRIRSIYGKKVQLRFCYIRQVTGGQAETVLLAKDHFDQDKDLVVFNIDTCFHSPSLAAALQRSDHDGVLGVFHSQENRFSYALTNDSGVVLETAEKEVISDNALTGLYHFKRTSDFIETASYHINNNIRANNEFYIAPMYNYLIDKGRKFIIDEVTKHHILGTPGELDVFLNEQVI